MPVWIIIIIILLLILMIPVGIDAGYDAEGFRLKLKVSALRKTLLPRQGEKKKKEKPPKEAEQVTEQEQREKKKTKLTLDDILAMAEIALDTLHRFRMHLSVDRLRLHYTASAADPYDAVLQYGRINALLGALLSKAHNGLKIRDEDVQTDLDLTETKPSVSAALVISIQIWEILLIGLCAGAKALPWIIRKKRTERAAAAAAESERSKEDGEHEYRESDGCNDAQNA